jgi:hypothetical protein
MATTTAITTIGPRLGIEFGTHEVFAACAAMAASTKDSYLIYKV